MQKQRETERQIQSRRGSRPSHAMEAKDQRGKPFSHLGRRSRKKKKKEGGSLPLASGGAGVPPGAIIITVIFTNNFTAFTTNSSPLYAAV